MIALCLNPLLPGPTLFAADPQAATEIQQETKTILESSQYRHLKKIKNPFLDGGETRSLPKKKQRPRSNWFPNWDLSGLGTAFASLFHVLAWTLLFAICAVGLYFIGRAIGNYERNKAEETAPEPSQVVSQQISVSPGETAVEEFWRKAREAAAAGQFSDAIQFLLQGAMSDIEHQHQIRFRRGLTLYDYLRALRKIPERYTAFKNLIDAYEPVGFGRHVATSDLFQQSLNYFEAEFLATNSPS